jgi:UDP-GlcNAc3NAcA epimerase
VNTQAMRVVSIVGARPQFVKAAMVSRALRARESVSERLIHTGQHFDDNMSQVFFDEMGIPKPDVNLNIGGGSHAENTGRMLEAIGRELEGHRPDWVVVYGDTDSTAAGALAAVKLQIPVAHVEAGLRSFNRRMPEEINRVVTDHIATLLLAPTQTAVANLKTEGVNGSAVRLVGDVMYDAALHFGQAAEGRSRILETLEVSARRYVLMTLHRASNADDPNLLRVILDGVAASRLPVVWPVHPRTRRRMADFGMSMPATVKAIDPVGYLDMVMLEKNAAVIATDSGGVQKEAFFYGVPCLTLREETEWTELVELGVNRLVGPQWEQLGRMLEAESFVF